MKLHKGRTRLGRACNASGKVTYTTRQAAKKHAKHLRSKIGVGDVYLCKHCSAWHLTSNPTRKKMLPVVELELEDAT